MKKIAIVKRNLGNGGIVAALTGLLNELSKDKELEVDLFLFSRSTEGRFHVPDGINVIYPSKVLDIWFTGRKETHGLDKLPWYFWHIAGKISMRPIEFFASHGKKYGPYDVAISFENDIGKPYVNMMSNDFALTRITADKKLGWSHNDPYRLGYTHDFLKKKYEQFDMIINVSKSCKKKFDEIIPEYSDKSKVVYNCVHIEDNEIKKSDVPVPLDRPLKVISVCRIDNKQKRIDRAIDVCVLLKNDGYGGKFHWKIYGDGPDRQRLEFMIKQKNVSDVIQLEGNTNHALEMMKTSDLFVMMSDYESFGLTLLESRSQELPVIVTDFPEAKESVQDGQSGYIVEMSAHAIAEKIKELIENPDDINRMRAYCKKHPVTNELAIQQFYEVINS